jgi:hypoxanthine phosphoribosyltransferase
VIKSIFKMHQRINDISLKQIAEYSIRLAHKIGEIGWLPEHILYVERAGLFVGHIVSNYFNCNISGVYCSRSGTFLKSKMKTAFRTLPRTVTHLLREIEIKSNIHSLYKERKVNIIGQYPPQDRNLLIVDDAVDTGYSIKEILDFLIGMGYKKERIKIAVLAMTRKNSARTADIFLFEKMKFAFPWSYDSREYAIAWKLYDDYKASIVKLGE